MKNIIKALVVFASVVAFSSANAGELTVTGTAKATYNIQSSDSTTARSNTGKGLGITNELAFTGTGELDNGFTWKYQVELDDNASGGTTSDDTRLEMTTPYGTVAAYNTEGSLNTKYKFSQAAYGAGSDNGASGLMQYGTSIDSYNNLQYHTPAGLLPYSTSIKVAYAPSAESTKNSGNSSGSQNTAANGTDVKQVQVTSTPIDGFNIGASYLEKTGENGVRGYEMGGVYATYAYGPFSAGLGVHGISNNAQSTAIDKATALTATTAKNVKTYENQAYSLAFAVNDDLTVSYEVEESTAKKRGIATAGSVKNDVDLEVSTMQAAYTMGGMTMSLSHKGIENSAYALAKDTKETLFVVALAF
jgi:outer membrane protein OmpU